MKHDVENSRIWVSRISFAVAGAAFGALVLGACQQGQIETQSERMPAAKIVPAGPATEAPKSAAPEPAKPAEVAEKTEAPPKPAEKPVEVSPKTETAVVPGALTVKRLNVTTEIKEREPVATTALTVGEDPMLAFVEMQNEADVDQKIVVTFEREGHKKVGFVELTIPADKTRWRTWAQTRNIKAPGEWTAVVSTADGTELARTTFEVSAAVGDG
jgi:hypothetical protein